jgi:hypothetical protein
MSTVRLTPAEVSVARAPKNDRMAIVRREELGEFLYEYRPVGDVRSGKRQKEVTTHFGVG